MPNGFDKLLDATGKTLEVAPKLYDDVVQPTAKESGKTLSILPKLINAAFVPLECWIEKRNYRLAETKKLLELKLSNISEDKIVSPDPYVAVPAIQAISYAMDSTELRELYANLLAKSMNVDTKDNVHPSYIEVIKQLSPVDASYFKHIYSLSLRPMVSVNLELPNSLTYPINNLFNLFSTGFEKTYELSIDNLSRIGIINIPNDIWYGQDEIYSQLMDVINSKFTLEPYKKSFPQAKGFYFAKRRIDITTYGKSFYNTCAI